MTIATLMMLSPNPLSASFTWQDVVKSYPAGISPVMPFASAPAEPTPLHSGEFVAVGSLSHLYEYQHHTLFPIPDMLILNQIAGHVDSSSITFVLPSEIQGIPIGPPRFVPFRSGTLLRAHGSSTIYQVISGVLHPLASDRALSLTGYTPHQIVSVPSIPALWPVGTPESATASTLYQGEVVQFGDKGPLYLLWNDYLHRIANPAMFHALGLTPGVVAHFNAHHFAAPIGSSLAASKRWIPAGIADGTLLRVAGNPAIYLVVDGALWRIPSLAAFRQQGAQWNQVRTVPTLPDLPAGPTL